MEYIRTADIDPVEHLKSTSSTTFEIKESMLTIGRTRSKNGIKRGYAPPDTILAET